MSADHVVVRSLSKRFGGSVAVNGVNLTIRRGEIHGMVGENGAGKSTLCKIIAGVIARDAGEVEVNGRPVHYRGPGEALADGITFIAQEVVLAPKLNVVANVFLGNESSRWGVLRGRELRSRYADLDRQVGFGIPARATVGSLVFGDQQKVEILRALARRSDLLILDEPTASLGPHESAMLFRALRAMRSGGATIIYISHHLEEVLGLCDTVTILRDGMAIRSGPASQETQQSLIQGMLGRPMSTLFPQKTPISKPSRPGEPPALSARALTQAGVFRDVTFDLHYGEILGVAGLVGAGRSEVARAIFGAERYTSGEVLLNGQRVRLSSPRKAARRGLAMIPESRRDQGLVLGCSVEENLTLVTLANHARLGVLRGGSMERASRRLSERLDIRANDLTGPVGQLSGGNQQKVVFGKWLATAPSILIADEPTRGVDVGAKQVIYQLICDLAAQGVAVLLISSELEEIIGLSHRVLVMRRGTISTPLTGDQICTSAIMTAAFIPEQLDA